MHIDIHVPRPLLLLGLVSAFALGMFVRGGSSAKPETLTTSVVAPVSVRETVKPAESTVQRLEPTSVSGDQEDLDDLTLRARVERFSRNTPANGNSLVAFVVDQREAAENDAKAARAERELLERKEDLLRWQLDSLEDERRALGEKVGEDVEERFRTSVKMLTDLLQDQKKAEDFLLASLRQLWSADERARQLSAKSKVPGTIALLWPVPNLGITAHFHDSEYEAFFRFKHNGIDLRAPRGTLVASAAGGIVRDVVDNGMGVNYITIDHGGYSTSYLHLLPNFLVKPGDHVSAGQAIGYSGGVPGEEGSGTSTGPHLHFGVYVNGEPVDPLEYLPAWKELQ